MSTPIRQYPHAQPNTAVPADASQLKIFEWTSRNRHKFLHIIKSLKTEQDSAVSRRVKLAITNKINNFITTILRHSTSAQATENFAKSFKRLGGKTIGQYIQANIYHPGRVTVRIAQIFSNPAAFIQRQNHLALATAPAATSNPVAQITPRVTHQRLLIQFPGVRTEEMKEKQPANASSSNTSLKRSRPDADKEIVTSSAPLVKRVRKDSEAEKPAVPAATRAISTTFNYFSSNAQNFQIIDYRTPVAPPLPPAPSEPIDAQRLPAPANPLEEIIKAEMAEILSSLGEVETPVYEAQVLSQDESASDEKSQALDVSEVAADSIMSEPSSDEESSYSEFQADSSSDEDSSLEGRVIPIREFAATKHDPHNKSDVKPLFKMVPKKKK